MSAPARPIPNQADGPLLLTPGPLTTAPEVRAAMLRDWGSRDPAFIALTRDVIARLLGLARAEQSHACILLQGSGTYAVEAALGSLVPRTGKLLILANGAYGRRMAQICRTIGRNHLVLTTPEDRPVDQAPLADRLTADPTISDVALVHCETTSGVLNDAERIAQTVAGAGRRLHLDAMSSFGAVPVDLRRVAVASLMASSNKCLEGAPGISFVLAERAHLAASGTNAHSLSLDLHAQWLGFEANGQWRFTPPTHVLAALACALDQLRAEGGIGARFARYRENCRILLDGMRNLGAEPLLAEAVQAPIIVTFRMPGDPAFHFQRFYDALARSGFIIYPGKLTETESFRVGCIGHLDAADMTRFVSAVGQAMKLLGVTSLAPARSVG